MGEIDEFNTLTFEKKLAQLQGTQESIQSLSSWCLKQREHHKKIVSSWLNVLKRVKIEQRLVLFYLANDVIQYSKRKSYQFVESWGLNLQKATPLVRDERVRPKILRIFKIWEQRSVYDDEFLSDLTGLLSAGAVKKTDDDPLDFQPQQLVNKIKQCTVLEADTDLRLKYIHESHLELSDADALCANLKDRSNKDDVEKELTEGIGCVERYTQALQREIVAREALLALLSTANQYYSTQRGEVKVVAYAYKNFGARVRALKRKLDELLPTLPDVAPSPPGRDEDVPSPGPDEDLDLPVSGDAAGEEDVSYNIDRTFNTSMAADGTLYNLGLSSFLSADNPMALFSDADRNNSNKIEVINNRPSNKDDFNINDFLKTLVTSDNNANSDNISVTSATLSQKSQDTLPGLDLLTPESGGNPPPPISFYGSMDHMNDDPEPYHPENTQWNNNTWNVPVTPTTPTPVPPVSMPPLNMPSLSIPSLSMPPLSMPPLSMPSLVVPPVGVPPVSRPPVGVPIGVSLSAAPVGSFRDTPESPPPAPPPPPAPVPIVPVYSHAAQDMPPADVDHRSSIIPPPPPPPVLPMLGNIEDVDHRMLPSLPPPPLPVTTTAGRHSGQQDVDHRNLISLTHMLSTPPMKMKMDPRTMNQPPVMDQDYRVPPLVAPSDIVESVDMDLSEDEDPQRMFPGQQNRNNFNNNKVLVGGDNGKTGQNHKDQNHTNLIQLSSAPRRGPPSPPPPHQPLSNPFDNMPVGLKNFNMPPFPKFPPKFQEFDEGAEENSDDSAYEEDLRSRGMDHPNHLTDVRNPSPPDYESFTDSEWQNHRPPFNNQRFPRNWGPRTNLRPPFGPQFWPRNGPRPPNRWMGPRPQRFW